MIFQFFLILTLSSVKVFASNGMDDHEKMVARWKALDNDHKGAITYLNTVDSLVMNILFTTELPDLSVGAIKIIKKEYTTVLTKIWELSKMDTSELKLDFNDDQVNNDKTAKAVLTKVDHKWTSDKINDVRDYFVRVNEDDSENSDLTRAVLSRFARFLPDDSNDKHKPDGIFFKLNKNFGGISGLMGNEYSETIPDPRVIFLNTVIKLSTIKNNPQSNKDDLKEISTLLVEFNEAAENENKAIAPENQNTDEVKENAKTGVQKAATKLLKKLNDVWVKLETGDTPPCEDPLIDYVNQVQLQPVYKEWFSLLTESAAFINDINDETYANGIFKLLTPQTTASDPNITQHPITK